MKLRNRVLPLMLVVLFVFNCFPPVYAARSNLLTLTDSVFNAITDTEYGSTDVTYQFDDSILGGVSFGDEVHLVADAAYDSTDVGNTNVTLTNFRLEGAEAASYTLPTITEPVVKQINITRKVIKIAPAKTYIYYGQTKTNKTNEIADYSSQIVQGDVVNLTAQFGIQPGDDIKADYSIWINGTIGCDNNNYTAELDSTAKFEVRAYEVDPSVNAETSTNDYAGVKTAILTAPNGFLISKDNLKDATWTSSIEIDLQETQSGAATYYLRCNDSSDTEYYQAISNEKTYNYTSIQTLPEIENIKIEKLDANATLNFLPSGVFGNGSINVTVEAVGTTVQQETKIYLGEDGAYASKVATSELRNDGKYHYTAVFTYDAPKRVNMEAYAVNSSGSGSKYAQLSGVNDVDGSNITVDSRQLVLDDVEPDVQLSSINGSYQISAVKAEVTISDFHSGIAKVEYLWDTEFRINDATKTDYVVFNGYSSNETKYEFILPWKDSITVPGNQHVLHLRVTDNAGNVCYKDYEDTVGSDMLPPNINSVEIRKAETSAADSVLRFFSFGTFSNDAVEIAIIADDNESITDTYASGVKTVTVNGRTLMKNNAGEYVLTVLRHDMIHAMHITVEDEVGWTTTAAVTDIPNGMGIINSNDLIVENDASTISWDFSFKGYVDRSEKIWYGAGDASETLTITVSDNIGTVNSGLYSLKITDNGVTKFEKTGFSSIDLEHTETYTIGDLADGSHTIVVEVEDNAGNVRKDLKTFYIDREPPESGVISATSPESVIIDGEQWFDKDEVITFRVDSSDADSGLKSISLNINDQIFEFVDDEILSDADGDYVIVNTTNLDPDGEHKYTVTGTVTDVAANSLMLEPFTVYKDFENPVISKFTAERKDKTLDKILNVLTFGTYSNDTLVFKAYASDMEYDSGIDYVTVLYEGLAAPEIMSNEGNGVFSVEIAAGVEVFESEIIITAYDKYGKRSITCPNIENAENGDLAGDRFVMIETIKPAMTLSLPVGDGVTRTDGQTWYKSNKLIELKVEDENSGIRNIDFAVNDVDIASDKRGVDLLKTSVTEQASARNTEEQGYTFDTDYFTDKTGESADGKYSINIESIDNAGNIETYETAYYIDNIAPQIDKIEFVPEASNGVKDTTEFIEKLDYGFFFKTDFEVTVNVSDELPSSGLNEVQYRFVPYRDGVEQEEIAGSQKITDGQAKLTVPKGFKGQIFVEAFDNVANRSGEKTTKAYVVDNAAPDITVTKNVSTSYHDAAGNNLYIVDNSITIEVTDTVSGIKEIGYSQSAEQNPYDRKTIIVNNIGYDVGDSLEDGWTVSAVDTNLVTKVTKTFEFSVDDNDVVLTFDASDNANNKMENVKSEKFTVDKTSPIINVLFRDDEDGDVYYNQNRIADITVIDRNFDENLIKVAIENKFGKIPAISFSEKSKTEHVAVIDFDEGDYTFDVAGTDLGDHAATVNFSGGNENFFFVDKTEPVIEENFASFSNSSTENSFNHDKTVTIKVTEHNFDPALVNLCVARKDAGADHNSSELMDMTYEVLDGAIWDDSGDVHTISFTVCKDAVYQVEISPSDLAGNASDSRSTVVFEIDKTVPIVEAKNGISVSDNDTECLEIYSYSRRNEPAPIVEFDDLNIDHIKYALTVYIPDHTSSEAVTVIRPVPVYLKDDPNKTGKIAGSKFVLPDFVEDGVYALELTAVDVAGNESLLNVNTYARMVNQDVLAYIMESNLAQKTGLYSFQYENGDAISKRPDNFDDIKIFVLARKDTGVDIVLRDSNGDELNTNAQAITDDSVYGMEIYDFTLGADFFKENFQDDTDVQLHLTVKNDGNRIDLGKLHIDNIAPTCDIPEEFRSWHWYYGEDDRTITVSNIDELIDESQCKVYDDGKEIAFGYSSQDSTIVFTLEKGWHNVGIILNDMAGNAYNIQEKSNIHIGFFWLWVIIAVLVILIIVLIYAIIHNIRKKQAEENNE